MLDIPGIFKNKVLNTSSLLAFGFAGADKNYSISYEILDGQFRMDVAITGAGEVSVKVLDMDSGEEYVLVNTPDSSGAFVGSVIQACEERLKSIAQHYFDDTMFAGEQAKLIMQYAAQTHEDYLEFLWGKFPGNAVLRRKDSKKWYAAMLTVAKAKLGLEGGGAVEVIDLRAAPEEIERLVDGKRYFAGYHMNKKHWYTICLDGSVPAQEIFERIETSYILAKK